MTPNQLQFWRAITPGLIALLFVYGALIAFGYQKIDPELKISIEEFNVWPLLAVFIFGVIYQYTPARKISNRPYSLRIDNNIHDRLCEIGQADAREHNWKEVRRIFYDFIDNDNSLTNLSQRIMMNGYWWSTMADLRVITFLSFFAFSNYLAFFMPVLPLQQFAFYVSTIVLFVISCVGSHFSTSFHNTNVN